MIPAMATAARPGGPRTPRERVDGVLWLDKPLGMSSNQALMKARFLLGALKAGHGGTLDPMATGLLPLMFGEATKFANDLLEADKAYEAEVCLGVRTDTGDAEGQVIDQAPVTVDLEAVRAVLGRFEGRISQIPPMHSALKKDGRPLYVYARAGVSVERQAREVTIHEIALVGFESPYLRLRVHCSKGTYIRTLAEDIGQALGCGAHLSALRRVSVGQVDITAACPLAALEGLDDVAARRHRLAPLDSLLEGLTQLDLADDLARRFQQGQRLRLDPAEQAPQEGAAHRSDAPRVRVYNKGRLLGIATLDDGLLVPHRLISKDPSS